MVGVTLEARRIWNHTKGFVNQRIFGEAGPEKIRNGAPKSASDAADAGINGPY